MHESENFKKSEKDLKHHYVIAECSCFYVYNAQKITKKLVLENKKKSDIRGNSEPHSCLVYTATRFHIQIADLPQVDIFLRNNKFCPLK